MLTKGKHTVSEIEGVRCTIVETGITEERMNFLKNILLTNKFDVKVAKAADADTYTIGVTDLIFNPVVAVYERTLKTTDGQIVSPAIWRQQTNKYNSNYWRFKQ